jgi:hypothetical protein
MSKVKIKPFNVIDNIDLPEITVNQYAANGDPHEIDREIQRKDT